LEGLASVGEASPREFSVTIDREATLRHALDAIVNTRNNVGVVVEAGRYAGMLTLEELSRELIG
jgi:Mg2+/Co2+ transporter CorB